MEQVLMLLLKNLKSSYTDEDKSHDKFKWLLLLGPIFCNNSFHVVGQGIIVELYIAVTEF